MSARDRVRRARIALVAATLVSAVLWGTVAGLALMALAGAIEVGVEVLSLFAFSQENWQRPAGEVSALMSLLEEYIQKEADELESQGVQVRMLGELERLTPPAFAESFCGQ